jgi:hypothetical protein
VSLRIVYFRFVLYLVTNVSSALNENLDKWAYYAAFWRTRDSVLVAAKRCAFSSR